MAMEMSDRAEQKVRVFISYSRKDSEFAWSLARALEARSHEVIFDQTDRPDTDPDLQLTAQDEWWLQIKTMIAASDVMVFVITPHSAASRVCDDEIAHARNLGKRVIAIERQPIDYGAAPERLRALHVKLRFTTNQGEAFELALDRLVAELEVNVDWRRRGRHWSRLADRWIASGRSDSHLMSSGAVQEFDKWYLERPLSESEPGPILLDFSSASRNAALVNRVRVLTTTGRAFVKPAEQAFAEGRHDAALRLAGAGALLAEDFDMRLVPERTSGVLLAASATRLRCSYVGHEAALTGAAFSPDGTRVVTSSDDGTARIWETATGDLIAVCRGHSHAVESASFSPNGDRIVTASVDSIPRIWDARDGREIGKLIGRQTTDFDWRHAYHNVVFAAKYSPNGQYIVTASNEGAVRVWDAVTHNLLRSHKLPVGGDISFDPQGVHFVVRCLDGALRVFSADGHIVSLLKADKSYVTSSPFCSNGSRIIAETRDNSISVWDWKKQRRLALFRGHEKGVTAAAFSPDGMRIVTASHDGTARIWDAREAKTIQVLRGHESSVTHASFRPDGASVTTTSDDGSVRIWDAATGNVLLVLRGHEERIVKTILSVDGNRILTASRDGTARLWEATLGQEIVALRSNDKSRVSRSERCEAHLSSTGDRIITVPEHNHPMLWDALTGREVARLRGHQRPASRALFSPDGRLALTSYADGSMKIWETVTGEEITRPLGHSNDPTSAVWAFDGSRVVTSSDGVVLRIWDVVTAEQLGVLELPDRDFVLERVLCNQKRTIAISRKDISYLTTIWDTATYRQVGKTTKVGTVSPDGKLIAVRGYRSLPPEIFDLATDRRVAILEGHGSARETNFNENGTRLVTTHRNSAYVWDAESGREFAALEGHADQVNAATFCPEGGRVITASDDGTARIWDTCGHLITVLHGHNGAVVDATFNHDGTRAVTSSLGRNGCDGTRRVWDIAYTAALTGSTAEVLAALFAWHRGVISTGERRDLLMQSVASEWLDLGAALIAQLESIDPSATARIADRARVFARSRHPSCYLPPSIRPRWVAEARLVRDRVLNA